MTGLVKRLATELSGLNSCFKFSLNSGNRAVGSGVVEFSVDFDGEGSLTACSIQLTDQRYVQSIATDDGVEIQVDVPI